MKFRKFIQSFGTQILAGVSLIAAIFNSPTASANIGQEYGFGARTAALGGAGAAWGFEGFAAYANPAALALKSDKRLQLSWGLIYMQPSFTPINGIVTQNSFNADNTPGSPTYDNVDNSYKAVFGQELGLSYRLFPDYYNFTFGIVTFLPISQIAYMDTGEAYVPEYVMYRARTQRPQVEVGAGVDLGKGFHLGVGMHVGFSLTGNGTVFVSTRPSSISSMRFVSSLQPQIAPYFGFLYTPPDDPGLYSIGSVVRVSLASNANLQMTSAARVFGTLSAVDFSFNATSTLFYDPTSWEIGGSWRHSDRGRIYGQVEWQLFSKFQPAALLIGQPNQSSTSTVTISGGQTPQIGYQNLIVPRIGEEFNLSDTVVVRAGYSYRPSIIMTDLTGAGNYLDPAKHMFNLGLGLNYAHFLSFETPCHVDFVLSYQALMGQHVTKNNANGNEAGTANDPLIGSPGYDVGGKLYGGGVSLSLAF